MLSATALRVRLGRELILRDLDFTAHAGQLTAIVGPNGSGKTTLLRTLTGELPHEGAVHFGPRPAQGMKPQELAALRGVLPQATPLAFPFTVYEVVRLGLESGIATAPTVDVALAAVGLSGFAERYYQELSGGEQQRAQLARVLAQVWEPVVQGRARWLFLDEPVASLDIGHQLAVMDLARDYARRGGGVVAVMHDLNLTAMFADRVLLLYNGGVLGHGRVDEVLTDAQLSAAYGCALRVNTVPESGTFVLPHGAAMRRV